MKNKYTKTLSFLTANKKNNFILYAGRLIFLN